MSKKKSKKKRIRAIQVKALKANKRFRNFTLQQNRYFRRRREKFKRNRSPEGQTGYYKEGAARVVIPSLFSISENVEEVLLVIYNTKKLLEKRRVRSFDFDFSKVKRLDDGAATILLSLCHDIIKFNKNVRANLPNDPDARKYMQHIGFRRFFQGYIPSNDERNETIKKGRAKILQKETVPIIHNAMKTVFGVDKKNQGLQGMLIELMTNSVNWIFRRN